MEKISIFSLIALTSILILAVSQLQVAAGQYVVGGEIVSETAMPHIISIQFIIAATVAAAAVAGILIIIIKSYYHFQR